MMNIVINNTFRLLSLRDKEEIAKLVSDAKTEKVAFEISRIVASGIVLSSGLIIEIAKIIFESTSVAAPYVANIALVNSVLINSNSLEIMKIIGSSEKDYQAKTAADISKNIEILLNENILGIILIASKMERESQSELFISIAKNKEILATNLTIKLMILSSKLDDEQIKLLNIVASDKLLEQNKRSLHYITRMLEEKNKIPNIYEQAVSEISLLKQKEAMKKKDKDLFWNVYKNNPNEAVELIKESDEQVLTTLTKVKKKISK